MKKLPEVSESFEELYRMLIAPIKSKLLLTGIELKVFNHLSEPMSAEAVAEAISTHPENTRLFLDGLAASDLVLKKNGLYQNLPSTQAFLVDSSPTFIGQMFSQMVQMWNPSLNNLSKFVKDGAPPPSSQADMGSEEMWSQYAISLASHEAAGPAQDAVDIISKLPEFPSFKKMLDLGGGPGIVGVAIVASHPNMKGVILRPTGNHQSC